MRRTTIFAFSFLACLTFTGLAQQPTVSGTGTKSKPAYYDTFKGPWIDVDKWIPWQPGCIGGTTLECVREIQQGRLRMVNRTISGTNQWGSTAMAMANPDSVTSISFDVTQTWANIVGCSSQSPTVGAVAFEGTFFNAGSGNSEDNVTNSVLIWVTDNDPAMAHVFALLNGPNGTVNTPIGEYPVGTP